MNKINLCLYSNEKFRIPRNALRKYSGKSEIFDNIFEYDRNWLERTDFYRDNKEILDDPFSKGDGWCLWKPYIIKESLNKIKDDEILIYMDSTDTFFNDFESFLLNHFETNSFLFSQFSESNPNINYTKKDTFFYMGCDSQIYWDSPQLEAGISGFKKCDLTVSFVNEYLDFCKDPRILKGGNSLRFTDPPQYLEHRYDQSVLSILSVKHDIKPNSDIKNFVECNIWESLREWGDVSEFSRKLSRIKDTCGGEDSEHFKKWASIYLPLLFSN